MKMTLDQAKEEMRRRVQFGEMSGAMCDRVCGVIDAAQAAVGNVLDHWDQLPADITTDPSCDGLRAAVEALRDNGEDTCDE